MEKDDQGRYTYVIPSEYDQVILNDNGGAQTDDLDVPASSGQTYDNSSNSWQ